MNSRQVCTNGTCPESGNALTVLSREDWYDVSSPCWNGEDADSAMKGREAPDVVGKDRRGFTGELRSGRFAQLLHPAQKVVLGLGSNRVGVGHVATPAQTSHELAEGPSPHL